MPSYLSGCRPIRGVGNRKPVKCPRRAFHWLLVREPCKPWATHQPAAIAGTSSRGYMLIRREHLRFLPEPPGRGTVTADLSLFLCALHKKSSRAERRSPASRSQRGLWRDCSSQVGHVKDARRLSTDDTKTALKTDTNGERKSLPFGHLGIFLTPFSQRDMYVSFIPFSYSNSTPSVGWRLRNT